MIQQTVSIILSKEYAINLAQFLQQIRAGVYTPTKTDKEFDLIGEISTEVVNQIADRFPSEFAPALCH